MSNHRIRKIDLASRAVTVVAGCGSAALTDSVFGGFAKFYNPRGVALSPDESFVLVADDGTHRIRQVVIGDPTQIVPGVCTTLAGSGTSSFGDGIRLGAGLRDPRDVAISHDGSFALFTDYSNHRIRVVTLADPAQQASITPGNTSTFAGKAHHGHYDLIGSDARFYHPHGIDISENGAFALVADHNNHRIRHIDLASRKVTTLAGQSSAGFKDATGTAAKLYYPRGVAISPDNAFCLVADQSNHRIRKVVIATKVVSTFAGSGSAGHRDATGTSAQFYNPPGIAISYDGSFALVADSHTHRIRHINMATRAVTTLAGSGSAGFTDHTGGNARFYYPHGVAISNDGTFCLIADQV